MSESQPLGLPSPDDKSEPEKEDQSKSGSAKSRAQPDRFGTLEECISALDRLPALVLLGVITPSQANAARGALRDRIAIHLRSQGASGSAAPINHGLLEQLRQHPELMNLMEPFLTSEQIAELMRPKNP